MRAPCGSLRSRSDPHSGPKDQKAFGGSKVQPMVCGRSGAFRKVTYSHRGRQLARLKEVAQVSDCVGKALCASNRVARGGVAAHDLCRPSEGRIQ